MGFVDERYDASWSFGCAAMVFAVWFVKHMHSIDPTLSVRALPKSS
jgi:hypothetical protein